MKIFGITISMIIIWLLVALIFLVIEALTAGLTTIWFAGGAIVAVILALFDAPIWLQIVLFIVISVCLLVFTRKIFVEKLKTGAEKTNVDALIGSNAIVVSEIEAYGGIGQVRVNGQLWSAIAENPNDSIEADRLVKIHAVQGVKLVVTPI